VLKTFSSVSYSTRKPPAKGRLYTNYFSAHR
jgi:hypothetical protein